MADKTVRRNNQVAIDWTIKNYVPKTVISLEVDNDPGAGFGTTALAPAPDANTKKNGAGSFQTVMPKLGTFVFTLTVKKPQGDEKKQITVDVKELSYTSFTSSAPAVEIGKGVTLSWQIALADGCSFKLVVTDPSGTETQTDVAVDAKGKGSFKTVPSVVGVHKFRMVCNDPTLQPGQKSPDSPVVQVDVRDHPVLNVFYGDFSKPSLELDLNGTALFDAPGYKVSSGQDFSKTGELARTADFDQTGNWKATQDVPAQKRTMHVEIFKSLAEAKTAGAKPILRQDRWFKASKTKGDSPILMVGTPKEGTLGEPFLDDARIDFELTLSAKRKKMIKEFLPIVMPSEAGSKAFDNLQTKAGIEATIADMPGYTTCVTVPPFLARKYGEKPHPFPMGGIIGCYWAATDAAAFTAGSPAWVVAQKGLPSLPKPGDLFIICGKSVTETALKKLVPKIVKNKKGQDERTDAFECLHVGVVVDVSMEVTVGGKPVWVVCQAGMGEQHAQKCGYTHEVIDPDNADGPLLGNRRLAGWIDIDNYLHWTV